MAEEFEDHGKIEGEIRELDRFLIQLDIRRTEFIRFLNTIRGQLGRVELEAFDSYVDSLTTLGIATIMVIAILRDLREKF